jgi:aspartate/tyrosine/aromatic aminotransferase
MPCFAKALHVYLVNSGRINVSGLNERNLMYFARSLDEVVREAVGQQQQQQRPSL